jgi:hypothetical protein
MTVKENGAATAPDGALPRLDEQVVATSARIRELIARANAGDHAAIDELRAYLDERPLIFAQLGNVARSMESWLIGQLTGGSDFRTECINRHLDAMRRDLLGRKPSPLEALLVERIVMTWLQLQLAEVTAMADPQGSKGYAIFLERRVQRIHRQYVSSIDKLAKIRVHLRLDKHVRQRTKILRRSAAGRVAGPVTAPSGSATAPTTSAADINAESGNRRNTKPGLKLFQTNRRAAQR